MPPLPPRPDAPEQYHLPLGSAAATAWIDIDRTLISGFK